MYLVVDQSFFFFSCLAILVGATVCRGVIIFYLFLHCYTHTHIYVCVENSSFPLQTSYLSWHWSRFQSHSAIPVPGHYLPLVRFLVNHRSVHIIKYNSFWLVPEAKIVSHSFSFFVWKVSLCSPSSLALIFYMLQQHVSFWYCFFHFYNPNHNFKET